MKIVKGFPQCLETISGKTIWNSGDPLYGIDVPVWKQSAYTADCTEDKECEEYCLNNYNAGFVNGKNGKMCYSYKVINHYH